MSEITPIENPLGDRASMAKMLADFIGVQQELPKIKKSKRVSLGNRSYTYASLEDFITTARPILNKHNFVLTQKVFSNATQGVCVETLLIHSTGLIMRSGELSIPIPMQGNVAQAIGSAETYARRYSLSAILGIADADDDDAQVYGQSQPPHMPVNQNNKFFNQRQQILNQQQINQQQINRL